jgi:hypothetical protein
LLSLADKAILDSQIELAKRVIERALAAARKSESDDLVKQATLAWSELEQPFTDEVKERARQRLRERDISPPAKSSAPSSDATGGANGNRAGADEAPRIGLIERSSLISFLRAEKLMAEKWGTFCCFQEAFFCHQFFCHSDLANDVLVFRNEIRMPAPTRTNVKETSHAI